MDSGLSDDVLSDEPVMPEIPIKPNKGIPITIGILLIIGALIVGSFAFGNLTTGTITEEEATAITDSLNLQGANLTNGEVVDYFGDLQKAGYYTTLGIIESLATLALLAGGALLIMGRKLGVWVGASGAGLMLLDAMVGIIILGGIEPPDPLLSLTMKILSSFFVACGLFCLALPFIPLLLASSRAALE